MSNTAPADHIDPDVKIPAAVRAAAALSEELVKAQQAPQDDAKHPDESGEAPAPVETSGETFTQTAPQAKSEPQQKSAPAPADDNWEHRYNSMKGRFERAEAEKGRLAGEIANLHRLLAEIQATQSAPAQSDTRFERLVTPEEEQDYGSDLLGVVGRKAKEELTPEIKSLKSQIARLEAQLQGVTAQTQMGVRERMYQTLDRDVPNWRELNEDPEFLSWLNLPDLFSGAIRRELLTAAYQRSDAARVAAFFKGFIADEAATNPAGGYAERPAPSEGAKRPSLESLAAPGRAKTSAAPAPVEKPFFTRAQISKFYSDVNRGAYRGREEEKGRIEKQIFDAQRDRRIRS